MKAVICAAGIGSRLGETGKSIPKCLIEIKGKTLLERQIDSLKKAGIEDKDICIVIGAKGDCWTQENIDRIKKLVKNVTINENNLITKNCYSLNLALNKIDLDDLLVIDGDLAFSSEILSRIISSDKNLILSKESYKKDETRNKILSDKEGRILEMGKNIEKEKLVLPYNVYGALIKINKQDLTKFKELIKEEKYLPLSLDFFVNELSKKISLYKILNQNWVNINLVEDLKKAEEIFTRNFVVIMRGYTATGKSTIAKKIASLPNTDLFHSSVIRKELKLDKFTNIAEADKFFDFRNNLRKEVDKQVYSELAKKAKESLKNGKNVVLDAGYFFNWQIKLVYDNVKEFTPELFFVRILCKSEEEIKRRIEERAKKFGESPLNETPSWNTYLSTKVVTEQIDFNLIPENLKYFLIEYDTFDKEMKLPKEQSENTEKIISSIKNELSLFLQDNNLDAVKADEESIGDLIKDKFVIALDFDGVITSPYELKTKYINNFGYKIENWQCGYDSCIRKLGIKKEHYDEAMLKAFTESPEKLPVEKEFLKYFNEIKKLTNISLFILTSRNDEMMKHLQDYLKYYKIKVDGMINTPGIGKIRPLKKIKANIFVEDSPFGLREILKEDGDFFKKCEIILYRNIQNKIEASLHSRIIEVDNWDDLFKIILEKHSSFLMNLLKNEK